MKKKKKNGNRKRIFLCQPLVIFGFSALCPLGPAGVGRGGWHAGASVCPNRCLLTTGQFQFSWKLLKIKLYWHLRKAVIVLFPCWHSYPMWQAATRSVCPSPRGVCRETTMRPICFLIEQGPLRRCFVSFSPLVPRVGASALCLALSSLWTVGPSGELWLAVWGTHRVCMRKPEFNGGMISEVPEQSSTDDGSNLSPPESEYKAQLWCSSDPSPGTYWLGNSGRVTWLLLSLRLLILPSMLLWRVHERREDWENEGNSGTWGGLRKW